MTANKPHGADWLAFVRESVGTNKWVVAMRLTPNHKTKGYELAITPTRWATLEAAFNARQTTTKVEQVALALFPDDYHDGHDCRAEVDRVGLPCRICADNIERWHNRMQSVRSALAAAGLIDASQ